MTTVKLNSSGLVKVTGEIIIDVDNTYATTSDIVAATSDATSVSTIANDAITSASDATTDADAASTSASDATTNADAASTSASDATTIADAASTSASNATTIASNATSNATLASTNAAAATSNATLASNLIIARDFYGATQNRSEYIGAVPTETMIIIVRNNGHDMRLHGSATVNGPATVTLIRGNSNTDEDAYIHVEEYGWTLFVRVSDNTFRHMIYIHTKKGRVY